jgi:hypothetical protein
VAAALAAVTLVTGCGGDEEATTVTVVETETRTVTVTEQRPLASPRVDAKPRRGELSFRGNGDRSLPPLRVRRGGATIRWANDGPVFSLIGQKGIIIDSVARSGSTYLPAGRHVLEVIAAGTWTLTIPRARSAS